MLPTSLFKALLIALLLGPSQADAGQASTRLTFDGRIKRDPVHRPPFNDIVFTQEDDTTGQMQLMRLNLADGSIIALDPENRDSRREYAMSADGNVFAFNTVRGLSSQIRVENRRTSKQIRLPRMGKANWVNWPCLSPDGERVVWVEGARVIYEYDLNRDLGKSNVRRLTAPGAAYSDYWPKYSPDGKQIVFASNRDLDFEIYIMNADGTAQERLTESPGIDMHPVFSPDGERVAFTSNRDGNYNLYLMHLKTRTVDRLTDHAERDDFACWLPGGNELVFVAEREGKTDLHRIQLSAHVADAR